MTIEKIKGVNAGGYRITDIRSSDNFYVSKLYIGYTEKQAIRQFKKDIKNIIHPLNK